MDENKENNINQKQEQTQEKPKNVNTGLISLEIVARMNNVNIDMRGIVREYGISTADISQEEIMRIAKGKGFKVKKKKIKLADYPERYPLPAIIQLKDDSYIVLLAVKREEEKVLTLTPLENQPTVHNIDELQEQIKDEMLVIRHKMLNSDVKFGFKWFFIEIFKYKKIIGQVLLGSFVIQLFGLVIEQFLLLMFWHLRL